MDINTVRDEIDELLWRIEEYAEETGTISAEYVHEALTQWLQNVAQHRLKAISLLPESKPVIH